MKLCGSSSSSRWDVWLKTTNVSHMVVPNRKPRHHCDQQKIILVTADHLSQISWQYVQLLSRHVTKIHKREPQGGARGKVRGPEREQDSWGAWTSNKITRWSVQWLLRYFRKQKGRVQQRSVLWHTGAYLWFFSIFEICDETDLGSSSTLVLCSSVPHFRKSGAVGAEIGHFSGSAPESVGGQGNLWAFHQAFICSSQLSGSSCLVSVASHTSPRI